MQPVSIKRFENFYLAAWGVSLIATFLVWDSNAILATRLGRQLGLLGYGAILSVGLLIPIALWYFTARRRSNVARWVVIGLFSFQALATFYAVLTISLTPGVVGALGLITFALRAVAVRFLFGAEANAWFSSAPATGPQN